MRKHFQRERREDLRILRKKIFPYERKQSILFGRLQKEKELFELRHEIIGYKTKIEDLEHRAEQVKNENMEEQKKIRTYFLASHRLFLSHADGADTRRIILSHTECTECTELYLDRRT